MQDPGLTIDSLAKENPDDSVTAVYEAVDVVDDYDYDYDTDEPHRTWPKLTLALFAGVLMAVAFTGGVLAQKKNDTGLTSAATSLPAGFPGGGAPFGTGPAAGGAGTTTGAGTTSPVLVGTVVAVSGAGTTVTVKDLGGKTHTVTTTGTTTVTKQSQKVTDLAAGDTVSINGKRATSGSVAATAFTIR